MIRVPRAAAVVLFAVLIATPAAVTNAQPATATTASATNVLYAGQRLTVGPNSFLLNGEFKLSVASDEVGLDQYAVMNGPSGGDYVVSPVWIADDPTGNHQAPHDHSTLKLRTNGDLVLQTSRGVLLWASHTAGTGTHNRLVLRGDGDLVLYTSSNKVVWSSHSGATILPAGRDLGVGHRLVLAGDGYNPIDITLTMQSDGNLVSRCGRHIVWQTHTHVRGSVLKMRNDAGLVVMTPSHAIAWSNHRGGHNSYSALILGGGAQLTVHDFVGKTEIVWQTRPNGFGSC